MKYTAIIICLLFAAACSSNQPQTKTKPADTLSKKTPAIQYTCTMHPEVITSKPGTCPKCGMELVEKDDSK